MSDEKEKRVSASGKVIGRPEKPEDKRLSVRIVVKVTPEMAANAEKRAEMLSTPAAAATAASYIRMLMDADQRAHGMLGASPEPAPVEPEPRPYPLPAPPPVLHVTEPQPVAAPEQRAPEPPTSPAKAPTPGAVRKLLERAYSAGLHRNDLAELSGVKAGLLSTFRNDTGAKLKSEQLSALDSALRRWLDEHS